MFPSFEGKYLSVARPLSDGASLHGEADAPGWQQLRLAPYPRILGSFHFLQNKDTICNMYS